MSLRFSGADAVLLWACFPFHQPPNSEQTKVIRCKCCDFTLQLAGWRICHHDIPHGKSNDWRNPDFFSNASSGRHRLELGARFARKWTGRDVLMMVLWALKGSRDLSNSVALQGAMVHYLNDWHSYALWVHLWQQWPPMLLWQFASCEKTWTLRSFQVMANVLGHCFCCLLTLAFLLAPQ